jgi:hypothetical protein
MGLTLSKKLPCDDTEDHLLSSEDMFVRTKSLLPPVDAANLETFRKEMYDSTKEDEDPPQLRSSIDTFVLRRMKSSAMAKWNTQPHARRDEPISHCSGLSPRVESAEERDATFPPVLSLPSVKSSVLSSTKRTNDEGGRARSVPMADTSVPSGGQENMRNGISPKILEKTEWLSEFISRGEAPPKKLGRRSVKPRQSSLVADRLAWMQALGESSTTNATIDMEAPMTSSQSDLVADRKRLLLEATMESSKAQCRKPSKDRLDPSLVQGLASCRSKWLESLMQDDAKTEYSEAIEKPKQPGKLQMEIHASFLQSDASDMKLKPRKQPQRIRLDQQTNFLSSTSRGDCKKPSQTSAPTGYGSIAEKRARYLEENQTTVTSTAANPIAKIVLGEPKMPCVDRIVKELSFLEHALTEIEQEGLLPDFLADHTTWLFGGFRNNRDSWADNSGSIVQQLRLDDDDCDDDYDYDAFFDADLIGEDDATQSTQEPESPDTHVLAGAETTESDLEIDIKYMAPSHSQKFAPPPSQLSHYGPVALEQTKLKDMPWTSTTYGEAVSKAIGGMTAKLGWHHG